VRLPVPPLLVISDRHQARRPLDEVAEAIFAGGCRWLSLREKDLSAAERRALLNAFVGIGRRWKATVTVHEDVETAVMAGAGGVHLPSAGDPAAARARLPGGLIGASAHSAAEASALLGSGVDYVTVSSVFITASKPGYGPAIGFDGLAEIAARVSGPVIALGGINAANAPLCLAAGASGVAAMGEVMRTTNPRAIVEGMLAAISEANKICG
jgi:thiamine-phosphate pyrophosphorylase